MNQNAWINRFSILTAILFVLSACSSPVSSFDSSKLYFAQLTPNAGSVSGNEWIALSGEGVGRINSVQIGDSPCTPIVTVSDQQIQCKTSAASTGAAKVDVVLIADASVIRLKKAFSWQVFLGQTDGYSGRQAALSVQLPHHFKQCGTHYVLTDSGNQRVLIYNQLPASVQTQPDLVLGQPSSAYVGAQINSNEDYVSSFAARSFDQAYGIACDANRLIVSDFNKNRVLVWTGFPIFNHQSADFVLGQSNFSGATANAGGVSGSSLSSPAGVWLDGERLIVADSGNHRVLIWNSFPSQNGQAADLVVGQTNFSSNTANSGGLSAASLSTPISPVVADGKLYLTDSGNSRVLVYHHVPSINAASASVVLGQSNFTTGGCNSGGISASALCHPTGLASDGIRLVVTDHDNHRVLVWSALPTSSNSLANAVLGQPDFVTSTANTGGRSSRSMNEPNLVSFVLGKLAVADHSNHRVLMWSLSVVNTHAPADFVLGQLDDASASTLPIAVNEKNLNTPTTPWTDGTRLAVGDSGFHRVMIWNSIPKTSDTAADFVLGQSNLTSGLSNRGASVTASTLNAPSAVFGQGSRFLVSDTGNHRVLIWLSQPTANGQAADLVLGQADFVSGQSNRGGSVSASTLSSPRNLWTDGTRLVLCDSGNNRVLIWNTFPASSGQAADLVLGQPDLTSNTANNGGVSPLGLSAPAAVWVSGNQLFVSDSGNHRVLIWNTFPTTNMQSADLVLGQPVVFTGVANLNGISGATLNHPRDLWSDGSRVVVADQDNHRILVWDQFPSSTGKAASRVVGQRTFLNSDYWIAPGRYPSVNGLFGWNGYWFSTSSAQGVARVVLSPAQ